MEKSFKDRINENGILLYEYVRGSHAYGLNIETSDIDSGAVYCANKDSIMGMRCTYKEQLENSTHDEVAYEIERYLQLLSKANPNILESLYVNKKFIKYMHPAFSPIIENREKFLTKKCFDSLIGYSISQIKKARGLNKKCVQEPMTERKTILDFCYTKYNQGSIPIKEWLDMYGFDSEFCGCVKVPNMPNTYGVYYDWYSHFKKYREEFSPCLIYNSNDIYHEVIQSLKQAEKEGNDENEINKLKEQARIAKNTNLSYFLYTNYRLISSPKILRWISDILHYSSPLNYKGLTNDKISPDNLQLSSVEKSALPICTLTCNINGYSQHCKDFREYKKWEIERNPSRYESNLNKNYDAKNLMHAFRLLSMGLELVKGEGFHLDRSNIDREFLLGIRQHQFEYDELIEKLEQMKDELSSNIEKCNLPDEIDIEVLNKLCIDIRNKVYNE